jgi:uncharacterized protein YbcV (DUF1398 family)
MNIETIHDALAGSLAGTKAFPDVVGTMLAEGVESYRADLVRMEETFYTPDGETHVEKMNLAPRAIGQQFSTLDVVAAIRASQAGKSKYPEFLQRVMDAGTTSYVVFLNGKKVIYFGRKGEFHIEEFPGATS